MIGRAGRAAFTLGLSTLFGMASTMTTLHAAPAPAASPTNPSAVVRRAGPAGSLMIVETNHAIPLVYVAVAARGGY